MTGIIKEAEKMKRGILIFLFAILVLPCVTANFYIINDTEKDHYALETIRLSGDLEDNELFITGSGEVISGSDVKVYLFGPSSDFLVSDVRVDGERASVSFDDKGYYFVAQKGEFNFNGKLNIRTIGQIRLYVPGPVNEIEFDIINGYTLEHNKYGLFDDSIIIQRSEEVAKRAEGEFHYMFDSYRNNYEYRINLKSFGSDLGRYELPLRNGENIHDVDGALNWEQKGNNLVLELEGDSATVTIKGTFSNTNLRVPIDEGKHHVLVESDPEKKITISTNAREIDVSESAIRPNYLNSRAFIASYSEHVNVHVRDLDLLPSLSASISNARQELAITPEGGVVGHSSYRYSNTGVDYIPIEIPGTPLYAATSRGPVKLTKDSEKHQFLLSFPKETRGLIELVYYETLPSLKPVSFFKLPLTDVDLPITKQDVSIIVPSNYYVLNVFGAKGGSELPSIKSVILFIVIIGGLSYLLFRNFKYALLSLVFLGFLFIFDGSLFFIIGGVALLLTIRQYTHKTKIQWKIPLIIIGVVFSVIIALMGIVFLFGGLFSTSGGLMASSERIDSSVRYDMVYEESEAMKTVGRDDAAMSAPMKEGVLPVKLELPQLGKRITVTDHLVTKEMPSNMHVLMVAEWLKYLIYLLGIICGYYCIRRIRDNWKKIWHG